MFVLSGIRGDETMGGVPTPTQELEDLLARGQFGALAHKLKVWALEKRKPWFHLFWEAAAGFFSSRARGCSKKHAACSVAAVRFCEAPSEQC